MHLGIFSFFHLINSHKIMMPYSLVYNYIGICDLKYRVLASFIRILNVNYYKLV